MFFKTGSYEVCLADWGRIMAGLCRIIDAPYQPGDFEEAESKFEEAGEDSQQWTVVGASRCTLTVAFEPYEGYFFGTLTGRGRAFAQGRRYLWDAYIDQGGNPDAQVEP